MLNRETKRRIDNARDILVGQLPLPSDQIELITIALIYKFMDDIDEQSRELGGKATFFVGDLRDLSWRKLISNTLSGDERVTKFIQGIEAVSDAKHQSIPELFKSIFKNAFLKFRDGQVLKLFLDEINGFTYDHSEELGNAFEYLLDTMGTQGQNGQFRTPRNIIEFIVDVVDPQKDETILDPACGTAGFLISAFKHILAANTSEKAAEKDPHAGDLLKSAAREKLTRNITGYDITPLMCRLSRANMYLHHFANPVIHEYDTLTNKNRWGDKFDVILANPPFMTPTGGISTHDKFRIAAKRAEVLFADFILEHLNANGRAGFIVPEGIIFQNSDDYISLRRWLINEAGLWAVVSLPANIFQPYSGVKTSVLLLDRALARQRDDILLVKVENDGFSLNTNRTPIKENDLPDALKLLHAAKRPDFLSAISNLQSPVSHRVVPRADFAKLDAYKASSTAWYFCRKFQVRAERLKKAAAEARAVGDDDEVEKVEKALKKVPAEFSTATSLSKLPATEAKLRGAFNKNIKAAAVTYGDNPNQPGKLTSDLREILDAQRDFNLSVDQASQRNHVTSSTSHELVKLGELASFEYGFTSRSTSTGKTRYVRISDIAENGRLKNDDPKFIEMTADAEPYRVQPNDIFIARIGATFGTCVLVEESLDAVFASYLIRVRFDDKVLPKFFWAFSTTENYWRQARQLAGGAAQPQFNANAIKQLKIPVPPIDEQRAIVAELEIYQRIVDGSAAVLDHYKPQLKIDADWPLKPICEIARFVSGGTPSKANQEFWTGKIPWVSPKDMKYARITETADHISETAVAKSATSLVAAGTVLCVIRSGILAHTFPVAIADVDLTFNQDITAIIADKKELSPEWLFFALRTFEPDILDRGIKRGGTVHSFHNGFLRTYPIPVPPLPVQQAIVADLQREQTTLAGLEELKAKYAAKIAARLAAVWGEKT